MKSSVRCLAALVVTMLVLSAATQPGLVLCHGADGHVAVESAAAHCCDGESAGQRAAPGASQEPDAGVPGCRGCVDVTLQAGATPLRRGANPAIQIVVSGVVFQATAAITPHVLKRLETHRGISREPGSERALVILRTVVLIC